MGPMTARKPSRCAGRDAAPTCCFRFVAPSIMAHSAPVSDRSSGRPSIHTQQWRSPPDPKTCGSPMQPRRRGFYTGKVPLDGALHKLGRRGSELANLGLQRASGSRRPVRIGWRIWILGWSVGWRRRWTSRRVRLAEAEVVRGPAASANADGLGRSSLRGGFSRGARRTACS
jgi:hypothetical protein